jgi:hypothetical protein
MSFSQEQTSLRTIVIIPMLPVCRVVGNKTLMKLKEGQYLIHCHSARMKQEYDQICLRVLGMTEVSPSAVTV